MGKLEDHAITYLLIIICTVIIMFLQPFLPVFLFPGFSVALSLVFLVILLGVIVHSEEDFIGYLGTFIGIFVAYFALIFLGLSIQTLLEIPTALNMPHISTISSVLELPILSDLYIIEGLIIATIAIKIKALIVFFYE